MTRNTTSTAVTSTPTSKTDHTDKTQRPTSSGPGGALVLLATEFDRAGAADWPWSAFEVGRDRPDHTGRDVGLDLRVVSPTGKVMLRRCRVGGGP